MVVSSIGAPTCDPVVTVLRSSAAERHYLETLRCAAPCQQIESVSNTSPVRL